MITAEIIAVGSELLTRFRTDTNSLYLTRTLEERGVQVIAKSIIGDNLNQLVFAFQTAFTRSNVILCSGGLGPTADDLTKEALAQFLEIPLLLDPDVLAGIEERFRKYNLRMPDINRKQAMIPQGAEILPNHHGSAPGVYLQAKNKQVFLLPGPPFELEPMWERYGLPLLRKGDPIQRMTFRMAMLAESQVDELLKPVTSSLRNVQYTILASPSEIEVHLLAPETSTDEMISAAAEIRAILGNHIFTERQETLEQVVNRLLKESGKKVAVAESCTGGFLAKRLTEIAGSSSYFERGFVTYSNEAKIELLGIPVDLIANHGAVSEPVAHAMAESVRKLAHADFGISITGIAGPEGGTPEKPVGTVFVGIADETGTTVKRYHFMGERWRIRFSSTQGALNLLRLRLLR